MNSYSKNANFWVDIIRNNRDRYRTELTDDAVLTSLGSVKDLDILDAGCGEGYLSRKLAHRGAQVLGIDITQELIDKAREKTGPTESQTKYLVGDITQLPTHLEKHFDRVVLNHVVNDLEFPGLAFSETARVLRSGGRAIILMLHPCFTQKLDDINDYFNNHSVSEYFHVDGTTSPAPVTIWNRSLESYFTLLTDAGLTITELKEPHPSKQQVADLWWKKHFTTPKFLLLETVKRE